MMRFRRLLVVAVAITTIVAMSALPAVARSTNNNRGGGNVTCASYGFDELKLDAAPYAGQIVQNGDLTVQITEVGTRGGSGGDVVKFKWVWVEGADVLGVIVKGGPTSEEFFPGTWGGWLWSPVHLRGPHNSHYGISNIRWCY
jgi:hypothetical protein